MSAFLPAAQVIRSSQPIQLLHSGQLKSGADVLLKGTRVDGVYSADPEKDPSAMKFDKISFEEVIDKRLKVMDLTAFTMCRENNMPVVVFDMNKPGNLERLIEGESTGTLGNQFEY